MSDFKSIDVAIFDDDVFILESRITMPEHVFNFWFMERPIRYWIPLDLDGNVLPEEVEYLLLKYKETYYLLAFYSSKHDMWLLCGTERKSVSLNPKMFSDVVQGLLRPVFCPNGGYDYFRLIP